MNDFAGSVEAGNPVADAAGMDALAKHKKLGIQVCPKKHAAWSRSKAGKVQKMPSSPT